MPDNYSFINFLNAIDNGLREVIAQFQQPYFDFNGKAYDFLIIILGVSIFSVVIKLTKRLFDINI